MGFVSDTSLLLSGISLAIIAYEIHLMNERGVIVIRDKVMEILHKIDSSWILRK